MHRMADNQLIRCHDLSPMHACTCTLPIRSISNSCRARHRCKQPTLPTTSFQPATGSHPPTHPMYVATPPPQKTSTCNPPHSRAGVEDDRSNQHTPTHPHQAAKRAGSSPHPQRQLARLGQQPGVQLRHTCYPGDSSSSSSEINSKWQALGITEITLAYTQGMPAFPSMV